MFVLILFKQGPLSSELIKQGPFDTRSHTIDRDFLDNCNRCAEFWLMPKKIVHDQSGINQNFNNF